MENLAKLAILNGGNIYPVIIPASLTNGTGLMNPSLLYYKNKFIVNLRHVNYTFYHSERKTFQHAWGPLTYVHPENDMHLRTINYYIELNYDFTISKYNKVDTSLFDTYEPKWDFVGLEDARLVEWNNKLYMTGVRRDTTSNGQGRMELSEIIIEDNNVKEISRIRIEPPKDKSSYCEKNWMPITDMPYHYVKWSNPTELVEINPLSGSSRTISISEYIPLPSDLRGGSQVIPFYNNYLAIVHEVALFNNKLGRKDAVYKHRLVLWNKNFEIIKCSESFSIMDGHVEFATGMVLKDDALFIAFGFQDNASFILEVPNNIIKSLL